MMHFLYGLLIFATAGVMNGSFALPSKRLERWSYERIWLNYSVWAFFIFPLLLIFLFAPAAFSIYLHAKVSQIAVILIGGFLFAIGQICFARALKTIGLGLGFVINISIGTALGSLIPLLIQHSNHIATTRGLLIIFAVALIILGVFISYLAGLKRDKYDVDKVHEKGYFFGVFNAVIAGLFSAGQNITFSYTTNLQYQALSEGVNHIIAANIIWPAFLLATFIPYALHMLYLHFKNNKGATLFRSPSYYLAAMMMGAFWYFSLILYSVGSLKLGELGPVIGWPLFMVCIILTANLWGWRHGEWRLAPVNVKRLAILSIVILILAIMVLGYGAFLRH